MLSLLATNSVYVNCLFNILEEQETVTNSVKLRFMSNSFYARILPLTRKKSLTK